MFPGSSLLAFGCRVTRILCLPFTASASADAAFFAEEACARSSHSEGMTPRFGVLGAAVFLVSCHSPGGAGDPLLRRICPARNPAVNARADAAGQLSGLETGRCVSGHPAACHMAVNDSRQPPLRIPPGRERTQPQAYPVWGR
jgi:hypothetical protein